MPGIFFNRHLLTSIPHRPNFNQETMLIPGISVNLFQGWTPLRDSVEHHHIQHRITVVPTLNYKPVFELEQSILRSYSDLYFFL